MVIPLDLDASIGCRDIPSIGGPMAFEHPTSAGLARLTKIGRVWTFSFVGKKRGSWRSPDEAAQAVGRHKTGLAQWDKCREVVSQDLLDWRPLGESI
jgi:hypothetical protein